jgi:hypothetical protein
MANLETSKEFISEARKRYSDAATYWSDVREEYNTDLRFVTAKQWDPKVKSDREDNDRPALTFNRLHTVVQAQTNQARQQRPQPKINPGDGGVPETADVLEGHIRHIQYASQADVAYDNAVEGSASGGFGCYRITTEYLDDKTFNQEPRIRRILDPMTVTFDPAVMEPDFSDAMYCFVRQRIKRESFTEKYGGEPVAFGTDSNTPNDQWAEKDHVWIAEYWQVNIKPRRMVVLQDGRMGLDDAIGGFKDSDVTQERQVEQRTVTMDLIDGARKLDHTDWLGKWIPIIPVLGKEVVVEGKRELISLIRYSRDPSRLLNAAMSGIAEETGLANRVPYIGAKGSFKSDKRWEDANRKNYANLEYDPIGLPGGGMAPPPSRNQFEPNIQALSQMAMQMGDAVRASVGYVDSTLQPSRGDLSGIAVQRRQQGQDLTNFHFQDNLVRSQWHAARVLIDLVSKLIDVPREIATREVDGAPGMAPVGVKGPDGVLQGVPGKENEPHHVMDADAYNVTISTGPSYNTKIEEEAAELTAILTANPNLFPMYADVYFKLRGYDELAERAKMMLPPAVQQASVKKDGIPPGLQAMIAGQQQTIQQLQQGLQQAIQVIKTKEIENQGKLDVEKAKTFRDVTLEHMKQRHEVGKVMLEQGTDAVEHLTAILHESELGATPGPGMGNNAPPEPPKGTVQ